MFLVKNASNHKPIKCRSVSFGYAVRLIVGFLVLLLFCLFVFAEQFKHWALKIKFSFLCMSSPHQVKVTWKTAPGDIASWLCVQRANLFISRGFWLIDKPFCGGANIYSKVEFKTVHEDWAFISFVTFFSFLLLEKSIQSI